MSQAPASFDMAKLSTGEKVVLGGAFAYFIWVFISGWYSIDLGIEGIELGGSINGMRFPMILAWLLAIVAIAEIALRQMGNMKMNLPAPVGTIHLAVAGFAFLFTLLGLVIKPTGFGVSWALFVGILITLVWAYGAYMMYSSPTASNATAPPPPSDTGGGFTS
jgi:hypothetical protein